MYKKIGDIVADREIRVGKITTKPGEKKNLWLQVGENQDSTPIKLPVAVINGVSPGPVLYIQAALGGSQLNTISVARRIMMETEPSELSGGIIATLIVNYFGFHHDPPVNWSNKDGSYPLHLNRIYPGRSDGRSSERIIHRVFNEIVPQSNYAIDVHQMGTMQSVNRVNVRVASGEPYYKEAFELARVYGTGFILDEKEKNPNVEGRLAWQATNRGIPAIDPELAGSRGWDENTICVGVKGICNVMKHLKMIEGEPEIPEKQLVASKLKIIRANRGGFIEHKAHLGTIVEKDEVISEISDPFGNVLEHVRSPEEGVLWALPEYPMLCTGQVVAMIGTIISYIE